MRFRSTALSKGSGIVAILWMALACAQAQEHQASSPEGSACAFTPPDSVHCGRTPTTAIDKEGRLWAAYERLRYGIDPSWYGETPRNYLYDAAGRRSGFSGKLDEQKVRDWLSLD